MLYAVCYHLYNLKNVKSTLEECSFLTCIKNLISISFMFSNSNTLLALRDWNNQVNVNFNNCIVECTVSS